MERDDRQLLHFSKHYLRLAKRLKCSESDQSKSIDQLFNDYPSNRSSNIYLLMAHLASAAYRIGTIIDKHSGLLRNYNYRKMINKKDETKKIESKMQNNLDKFLPLMLRDLVGHKLRDPSYESFAIPREKVIHNLTPVQCLKSMEKAILEIERVLKANQSKNKNRVLPGFNGL